MANTKITTNVIADNAVGITLYLTGAMAKRL